MKTEFANLIDQCGLSKRGAARLLRVRYETLRNWYYGRCETPSAVIEQLKQYAAAAERIFTL